MQIPQEDNLCEALLQKLVISRKGPWPLLEVLQTLRGPIGPSLKIYGKALSQGNIKFCLTFKYTLYNINI